MKTVLQSITLCVALLAAPTALAQTAAEGGSEIWDLSNPAAPRHWHTGLSCWDSAADAPFRVRTAYNATGSDVGCAYDSPQASANLYVTMRQPSETYADIVRLTRAGVLSRYQGARVAADGVRTIQTSAGPLQIDEYILVIDGSDRQQNETLRGGTGVWHADVAGWTLKVRLTVYDPNGVDSMPLLAEALMARAYAEMQTARDCANAGMEEAPNLQLSQEEGLNVQIMTSMLLPALSSALPDTPLAARQAGYVCLGQAGVNRQGVALVGVMQPPGPADGMFVLLGIGEVRPPNGAATMTGVFESSMNPLAIEGARTDRGHFAFAESAGGGGFYGALDRGRVRENLVRVAGYVASGAQPLISVTSRQAQPPTQ